MTNSLSNLLKQTSLLLVLTAASSVISVNGYAAQANSQSAMGQGSRSVKRNTSARRSTLADYIPCRFLDAVENEFRQGSTDDDLLQERKVVQTFVQRNSEKITNPTGLAMLRARRPDLSNYDFVLQAQKENVITPGANAETLANDLGVVQAERARSIALAPTDVGCSQSMLSWKEADLIFGRAVANNYVVIQVNTRNLSEDHEFLLHDVQVAVADVDKTGKLICPGESMKPELGTNSTCSAPHFVAGRDKILARGVLVSGKSESPRNISANVIDVAASVLSATSGVLGVGTPAMGAMAATGAGRQTFSNFVHIFSAVAMPGFNKIFPDYTIEQLNRLNDTGFSSNSAYKIVVPKNGSVPFVTFLSAKIFADTYKKWDSAALKTFQRNMVVVVSGKHIAEVDDQVQATLACPSNGKYLDYSKADKDSFSCTITGTNLQKIGTIQLQNSNGSDSKTIDAKVSVSGGAATAVFSLKDLQALTGQNYTLVLPDAKGNLFSTTNHVSLPPVLFSTEPTNTIDTDKCSANGDCSLKLTGTNLEQIGHLVLKAKDEGPTVAEATFDGVTKIARFKKAELTGLSKDTTYRLQVVTLDDSVAIMPSLPIKVAHP